MQVGTKSLLFGVHQFVWHPITVLLAWTKLYGWPNWRELVCIIIHDWGYWGSPNMDGQKGEKHPELAAKIAEKFLGREYFFLCLLHSRHYARRLGLEPSKLCWADKLSILYDPGWLYLLRANLSGEIKEYRNLASAAGFIPLTATNHEWFIWIREKFAKLAREMRGDAIPYMNQIQKEKTGIDFIAAERQRQIEKEGWTPNHDDQHDNGELAMAAACYAVPANYRVRVHYLSELWPWALKWWKPTPDSRIRELQKAGALIAAEIDRLQRAGVE